MCRFLFHWIFYFPSITFLFHVLYSYQREESREKEHHDLHIEKGKYNKLQQQFQKSQNGMLLHL